MPRPYDCVRRGWHSDRHQPIRGTLIQEIFSVVNEIHGSSTKKNKEYQEKLPIVVLRAEEIMYSKANSESEYMDLATLLDRTNDAIDTIIRREEHTETGEYLRPCIEAALSLGCCLTKASSRSQRNSSRCYLSEEVPNVSHTSTTKSQYLPENLRLVSDKKQCLELDNQIQPPSNLISVYPLYYGNNVPIGDGFKVSHESVSNTRESAIMGGAQGSQSFITIDNSENSSTNKCDLSLRLGPPIYLAAPAFEYCEVRTSQKEKDKKEDLSRTDESIGVQ